MSIESKLLTLVTHSRLKSRLDGVRIHWSNTRSEWFIEYTSKNGVDYESYDYKLEKAIDDAIKTLNE